MMMLMVVAIMVTVRALMMLKLKKVTWLETYARKKADKSQVKSKWYPGKIQVKSR